MRRARRRIVIEDPMSEEGLRRVKHVASRQVPPDEAELMWNNPPPPPRPDPVPEDNPWLDMSVIVDPTRFGKRHRKRIHLWCYRLGEVCTWLSLLSMVVGVIVMALGDRPLGHVLTGSAFLCGVVAWVLSAQSKLSARVLAYAVAATILAGLAAGATFLVPETWF